MNFHQPNGALGTHTGQPWQNAHALVNVTERPAMVSANTTLKSINTRFANNDRREYFMDFLLPVCEHKMDNQKTRSLQKRTTATHNPYADLRSDLIQAEPE